MVARLSGPMPNFRVPASVPLPNAQRISADRALGLAQAAMPDMIPLRIAFPLDEEGSFAVQMTSPGGVGISGQVSLDQYTGKALAIVDVAAFRGAHRIRRFAQIIDELHTGRLFGTPTEILVALSAVAILHQIGGGLVLYFSRWRERGRRS
jgi:uncharacterized iron-regulated membrane protein